MKISTKGRYGLRAMIDLATYGTSDAPVFLSDIAKRQGISEKYLEHIFGLLHRAGLVKALRGRKGGYLLTRLADAITLNEIITVLEGPCNLVDCVTDTTACPKIDTCVTREIWSMLGSKIEEALNDLTLASLAERQMQKTQHDMPMYYI
ncbi:MAG: HTH-type transcriptional regulator CymR [Syntrophorhabdus sp. PtaU1.Bin050]|nr:MAG: HTH-type transcriptional regulator CymR [Syntrophorhabdus sp. PtaU1.Bin050]